MLVFDKPVFAGFRGIVQAVVIYPIALALYVAVHKNPQAILGVLGSVLLALAVKLYPTLAE